MAAAARVGDAECRACLDVLTTTAGWSPRPSVAEVLAEYLRRHESTRKSVTVTQVIVDRLEQAREQKCVFPRTKQFINIEKNVSEPISIRLAPGAQASSTPADDAGCTKLTLEQIVDALGQRELIVSNQGIESFLCPGALLITVAARAPSASGLLANRRATSAAEDDRWP